MANDFWQEMRSRSFLFAQRNSVLLPTSVKRRIRGALSPAVLRHVGAVDDWSQPLLPGNAEVPLRWPELRDVQDAPASVGLGPMRDGKTHVRCLLATDSLDAGGMDAVVGFLARGLPQFGVHVAVVHTPTDPSRALGRLGHLLRTEGVEVTDLNSENCGAWIREWQPDVVSVHGAPEWLLESASACSIPVVETLHGMHNQFNAEPSNVARRRALLAGLVSVSDMVREQYLEIDELCDPDLIVTIPNGVTVNRKELIPREQARKLLGLDNEYLFVSLSRHCLQKNTYGLASAFFRVADAVPDAHLLICGRPDDAAYTGQVARLKGKMRHGDRLHLRDHTPHTNVLLAAADCFVLDSFFEGWALSSMEALVAGLPVIVSDVGGAREQLANRPEWGQLVANPLGNGLHVEWNSMSNARFQRQVNQDELVAAMVTFSRNRNRGKSGSDFGAEAAARFDGARCLRRHARVLRAAASGEPVAYAFGEEPSDVEMGLTGS